MKVKLTLFMLFSFHVNGLYGNVSKFEGFNLKPVGKVAHKNDGSFSDAPLCQSIIAYYIGTLQNKKSSSSYDVQFQANLWVNKEEKKIHVLINDWNEKYSKSENFELDFYYGGNREWCDIYDKECISSFTKNETTFTLDLNTEDGNYFHLLSFKNFNNSFVLNKPKDKCTKHQLDDLNDNNTPDLNQLNFCVCCDSYEPNELLGCPNDKWSHETSPKPSTHQPIKTTPAKPPPHPKDVTCKSAVGYYNGLFQNKAFPDKSKNVEFQIRVNANDTEKVIYFYVDQWNEQKSNSSEFTLYGEYEVDAKTCDSIFNPNCSLAYVKEEQEYLSISFQHFVDEYERGWNNDYDFLFFPNFDNSLTVTKAIGQCTKHQYQDPKDEYDTNTEVYEYCLCCGDKYEPHPALGCPENPWT